VWDILRRLRRMDLRPASINSPDGIIRPAYKQIGSRRKAH
jgi:hypothetical protein